MEFISEGYGLWVAGKIAGQLLNEYNDFQLNRR